MALEKYDDIYQRAAARKGGTNKLKILLGTGNQDHLLSGISDDRFLAEFSKKVFQSGFVWRVVENKWPNFEESFFNFNIEKVLMMPEEMMEDEDSEMEESEEMEMEDGEEEMSKEDKIKNEEIKNELKELVIARLDTFPANKKISIGSSGEFKKDELIEHVRRGDNIGRKIIEVELAFLRAQKEGLVTA